jgi:hypothetical protein
MHMDKIANSHNDEFFTPLYAVKPLLKYVDPQWKVWCPFDTEHSHIVKALTLHGNTVRATHISSGTDFFTASPGDCDCIISNPPYSRKGEVLSRLFSLSVPFAMLVGVVGLFESKYRFDLFKDNQFEVMYLSKRISYFKSYEDQKPSINPPFSSVWLTSKVLQNQIVFEYIQK